MFSFLEEKKDISEPHLVCDITSDSVHICLYNLVDKKPKVLYYGRRRFSFSTSHTHGSLIYRMKEALEIGLLDMWKQKIGKPKSIQVFLNSPWYISQTRSVNISQNTPFIITKKKLDEIIEKEVSEFENIIEKNYTKNENSTPVLIERSITSVKINGYGGAIPFGKKIKNIYFTLGLSASTKDVIFAIEDSISHYFIGYNINYSSSLSVLYKNVRELNGNNSSLISTIGGEVTDIFVIKDGVLLEHISFPLGIAHLLKVLNQRLGTEHEETLTMMRMYVNSMLDIGSHKKIEISVNHFESDWRNAFFKILSKMSEMTVIPNDIYIHTTPDLMLWFRKMLENDEFTQFTLTKQKFNVILLDDRIRSDLNGSQNIHESFLIESFLKM